MNDLIASVYANTAGPDVPDVVGMTYRILRNEGQPNQIGIVGVADGFAGDPVWLSIAIFDEAALIEAKQQARSSWIWAKQIAGEW